MTRARNARVAFFFVLLVIVLYSDPLLLRRNFTGRDLVVYNLPMEKMVHDAYARGRLPIWSPEISGGRPLLPNPNAGALYPVRPLLSVVSFPAAMRIFPVLHWTLAGLGMIFLLGALGVSRAGCWIGAVTYSLSAVAVSEVFYPHIQPGMTLLPWAVWFFARRGGSREWKLVGLSILFGLLFLAGDVFTSGMAAFACLLWILIEEVRGEKLASFVLLCLSGLLGVLIALPQIVATALWIPETNRAVLGMRLRESLFYSIHPLRLLELVVPYPFGPTWNLAATDVWGWPLLHGKSIGLGLFSSLYAGAFAGIAAVTAWRSRERGARFARYLFLLALLVSVLPSLIPSAWAGFQSPLPLRNPEKFAVALTLALAVFAGLAFDRLRSEGRERRWVLAAGVLISLAAASAAVFPNGAGRFGAFAVGRPELASDAARLLPAALAEGGLLWIATVVALALLGRRSRPALAGSLALLTLVPIVANRRIARTLTEQEIFAPTPFSRLQKREDPEGVFRTLGESFYREEKQGGVRFAGRDDEYTDVGRRFWIYYTPAFWGRGMVFNMDFDVGDFSRVESLRRLSTLAARASGAGPFFASLSLKYGIRLRSQQAIPGYQPIGGDFLQYWDVQKDALPHVRLAESWTEETTPLAALTTIPRLGVREIVLETRARRKGRSRAGTVRVVRNLPENLVVEVDAPDPTWLFVLRGFWLHRKVEIDGRPVEDVPAQVAFSAVPVPPGRHTVVWQELVPGGNVSRLGPVVYVLLAAGLIGRERLRRKTTR